MKTAFVFVALLIALSVTVSAQCVGGDVGGNVTLTLNGDGPDGLGQVEVGTNQFANFTFTDTTMGLRPLIVVIGNNVSCAATTTPWGGTVDLSNPSILIDGLGFSTGPLDFIGNTNLSFGFVVPAAFNGLAGPGIQGIHTEPTNPPFFLDNTVAVEGSYVNVMVTNYSAANYGDDDNVPHALAGAGVTLYGVTYTTIFLGSNGQVTLNEGADDFAADLTEFFNGWSGSTGSGNPTPGVAGIWGDFNPNGIGNITVTENLSSGDVDVTYSNQEWWDSGNPAGAWSVCFDSSISPGSVVIDLANVIPGQAGNDQDPVSGITTGNTMIGSQTTLNFAVNAVGYASMGNFDSIGSQFLQSGNDPANILPIANALTFLDVGNDGTYVIF